jgi:hypothetical protein
MRTAIKASHHKIRRVVFDLRFPDEGTAFYTRKRLEEGFHQIILPVLQEAFDEYASNGIIHHIHNLEINLGSIDPDFLDNNRLSRLILAQLYKRLKELSPGEIEILTPDLSLEDGLINFLQYGVWPWQFLYRGVAELEEGWLTLPPAAGRRLLIRLLPLFQHRQVRLRLLYQFSPGVFDSIMAMLRPETAATVLEIGRAIFGRVDTIEIRDILLAVIAAIPPDETIPPRRLKEEMLLQAQRLLPAARIDPHLDKPGPASRVTAEIQAPFHDHPPAPMAEGPPPDPGISAHLEESFLQERTRQEASLSREPLYVRYAGSILLHPFLAEFFGRVRLLDDRKQFASATALFRAIHVLHFMVTGNESPEEPLTLWFKVLCGLPLETPLPKYLFLSPEEKGEAEGLLTAVISHWTKLGNTSPAGLRETFLQRDGKLTRQDQGWLLHVERKSLDILLGYLPWSLSVVRLPWLEAPIYVEWV